MAELNNEEIRSTLQDLVSSPDFNVNDLDTKKQLNNILSQVNVYNYLNHDKRYIGIKCLSLNEYNEYIINGTCDGSITANSNNAWRKVNNETGRSYCSVYAPSSPDSVPNIQSIYNTTHDSRPLSMFFYNDSSKMTYFRGSNSWDVIKTYNVSLQYEFLQNNKANTMMLSNDNLKFDVFTIGWYDHEKRIYTTNGRQAIEISKNYFFSKSSTSYSQTIRSYYSGSSTTLNLNIYFNFRPSFFYIDNNKSKNIYY